MPMTYSFPMYQADRLEARFVLTDEQFGRLQAEVDGMANRTAEIIWNVGGIDYAFPARIDRIGAEIASARGGVEVFATIGEAEHAVKLRPGAFVEIHVPDRRFADHVGLPIPLSIIATRSMWSKMANWLHARSPLPLLTAIDVILASGLGGGEEVLTTRISEISPG